MRKGEVKEPFTKINLKNKFLYIYLLSDISLCFYLDKTQRNADLNSLPSIKRNGYINLFCRNKYYLKFFITYNKGLHMNVIIAF